MEQLPIFLNLRGRTVVVVGSGAAASAKARLVERAGGIVVPQWTEQARLAFVAVDNADEACIIANHLRSRGLLVNVVDQPEHCDFTTPAIIDRAPVTIAVGTGGASAGLAKAVRQRIEALLPARLGALALALNRARGKLRLRWPDADARRRAIDAALAHGGVLDPMDADAAERVEGWAEHARGEPSARRLVTVPLGSDDPDDLTLATARLLGEADHVFHAAGVPDAILNRARADAVRHAANAPPTELPPGLSLWIEARVDITKS